MNAKDASFRKKLVFLAFLLFSIFLVGIFWLSTSPGESVSLALSYAAGLSMIVLPCTLPLAFVIVPISMSKSPRKGLGMALLFGLGLTITITLYGVLTASLGQFFGLDSAVRTMWVIAGLAAFVFGLNELKLISFELPSFGGAAPAFIEKQGDYLKAFFLGLFLGNAGVGCPNPAFYVLLTYIASTASLYQGALLGFVHGVGRATPLIFLAILGILGVNATGSLVKRKETVERSMGWLLVGIGAFILLLGLFGHGWWERSPIHFAWNKAVESIGLVPELTAGAHQFMVVPWSMLILLIVIPFAWSKLQGSVDKKVLSVSAIVLMLIVLGAGYFLMNFTSIGVVQTGETKEFDVVAFQFGFDPAVITVNEGDRVILHVTSRDVTHGFAVDEYGIRRSIVPGEPPVTIDFIAFKAGTFEFYCSVACGPGHNDQKGVLIVNESDEH